MQTFEIATGIVVRIPNGWDVFTFHTAWFRRKRFRRKGGHFIRIH